MFIVGLTGGLATGKSTVLDFFRINGVAVVDADQIAREVVEPGKPCWDRIVKEFGTCVLTEDGKINRAFLGTLVFDDIEKRKKLNSITHPQIQKTLVKMAIKNFFEGHPFVVMELPLLFETGRMMSMMHKIITVVCEDAQQLERLCQRNSFTAEIARKRISAQMPLEDKVAGSHFVINNSGTFDDAKEQTEKIIRVLKSSNFHWYIRSGIISSIIIIPCLLWYLYVSFR